MAGGGLCARGAHTMDRIMRMIPRLSPSTGFDPAVTAFIQTLKQNGFNGECDTRYGARLTMATDNSIYQLLPDAVLFRALRQTWWRSPAWPRRRRFVI